MNPRFILPLLLLIAPLSLLLALAVGSVPVAFGAFFDGSDALGRSTVGWGDAGTPTARVHLISNSWGSFLTPTCTLK